MLSISTRVLTKLKVNANGLVVLPATCRWYRVTCRIERNRALEFSDYLREVEVEKIGAQLLVGRFVNVIAGAFCCHERYIAW